MPGSSSIYFCTCLSTFFVSPSSIPHYQRNSYIHLFFETPRTHIFPYTQTYIRVLLLHGQSILAHKIIHISIVLNTGTNKVFLLFKIDNSMIAFLIELMLIFMETSLVSYKSLGLPMINDPAREYFYTTLRRNQFLCDAIRL